MVLICRYPSTLRVFVGDQTIKKAFTTANRERLSQIFLSAFRTKDFDQGLLNAVEYGRQAFDENLGPGGKPQTPPAPAAGSSGSANTPGHSALPPPVNVP